VRAAPEDFARAQACFGEALRIDPDYALAYVGLTDAVGTPGTSDWKERAELAMALWDSLSDAEREAELSLTPEQEAELDRRWAEHLDTPDTAIPWEEVRRKLQQGSK
jgi:putative addiction module component (TIGR02574 family)